MIPEPIWPALLLATIQGSDAVFCWVPMKFVTDCLDGVGLPERVRPALPVIKASGAFGLFVGLWVPYLAAAAGAGLVLYFTLAVGAHIRAHDYRLNIFNATVLLGMSAYVASTTV